jgi:hypothetical protein
MSGRYPFRVLGAAVLLAAGCSSPAAPAPKAVVTLLPQSYMYVCGSWGTTGAPPANRTVVDLLLTTTGEPDQYNQAAYDIVIGTGAKELYRFHSGIIRFELDVSAVPAFAAPPNHWFNWARTVPDPSNHLIWLTAVFDHTVTATDLNNLRSAGAISFGTGYANSPYISFWIEDPDTPAVATVPHLRFAAAEAYACIG